MSELDELERRRRELERIAEVRMARLKTRKRALKDALQARLALKGVVSRFPFATLALALGAGWLLGRAIGAALFPEKPNAARDSMSSSVRSSKSASLIWQPLKEFVLQALTNFALNKTREFLVNRFNRVQTSAQASAFNPADARSQNSSLRP